MKENIETTLEKDANENVITYRRIMWVSSLNPFLICSRIKDSDLTLDLIGETSLSLHNVLGR